VIVALLERHCDRLNHIKLGVVYRPQKIFLRIYCKLRIKLLKDTGKDQVLPARQPAAYDKINTTNQLTKKLTKGGVLRGVPGIVHY
jgi:hypothetical protein